MATTFLNLNTARQIYTSCFFGHNNWELLRYYKRIKYYWNGFGKQNFDRVQMILFHLTLKTLNELVRSYHFTSPGAFLYLWTMGHGWIQLQTVSIHTLLDIYMTQRKIDAKGGFIKYDRRNLQKVMSIGELVWIKECFHTWEVNFPNNVPMQVLNTTKYQIDIMF